ncbi:hypothetical protein NB724_004283 [Pantoea ananatis]|nr:hypothetical protein [Pantoea ananatis]MCW0337270.1 hypothetical protein [Pantoea ananatis]MCW0385453.1 hypothetical protein [Pantoea ananatis]MCW0410116.1 hypothetical protein [Pantoea ananatis]MCW0430291.1 hypothetical protein [Pantoea ananatis]
MYSDSQSYEPLARIDGMESPEIFWFHCAANGTPELLTDVEGQKTWEGVNSPWGKLLRESNQRIPVVEQNLRMQGQYLDRETGLHYNMFRYYDPDSGRFTQQDPIGLAGGINLYQYAPNALGWVDPWGLSKCSLQKKGQSIPDHHKVNFTDGIISNRQVSGDEIFYKYHGKTNRLGRDFNYVTKKKYTSEAELRKDLAILKEWGVKIDKVTTFKPQKGTWITEGTAAPQISTNRLEVLEGGGYQGLISIKELAKSTIIRTDKVSF